jgi:hypothetical protein
LDMKFFKQKEQAISNLDDPVSTISKPNIKKPRKKRQRKYESIRECFGICGFLRTSWKLFKEFSADTSIHGKKLFKQNFDFFINTFNKHFFICT